MLSRSAEGCREIASVLVVRKAGFVVDRERLEAFRDRRLREHLLQLREDGLAVIAGRGDMDLELASAFFRKLGSRRSSRASWSAASSPRGAPCSFIQSA
jgi:hypothetical protein